MITLIGPPGVGKTRPALHVAWDAHERYEHGVWFVPLAAIADPGGVPTAIAAALEVPVGIGEDALARVKRRVRDQHALLVLDNFEQVLSAGPLVASCWLRRRGCRRWSPAAPR